MNFTIAQELTFIHTVADQETQFNFYVQENAQLNCVFIATDATVPTLEINIYLTGRNARATCKQLVLLRGAQTLDLKTVQHHQAPATQSELIIKTVLADSARFTFNGLIAVDKEAKGTQAVLSNKNIVLSSQAHAYTKPQLEVATNDVQCKHGSAVSRLDKNHLLYLKSRGIPDAKAQQLLLEGFVGNVVEMVDEQITSSILNKMSRLVHDESK